MYLEVFTVSDFVIKIIGAVVSSLTLACIGAVFAMWNSIQGLQLWKDQVHPLEKQALLVEHAAFELRLSVLDLAIMELEDDLEDHEQE